MPPDFVFRPTPNKILPYATAADVTKLTLITSSHTVFRDLGFISRQSMPVSLVFPFLM